MKGDAEGPEPTRVQGRTGRGGPACAGGHHRGAACLRPRRARTTVRNYNISIDLLRRIRIPVPEPKLQQIFSAMIARTRETLNMIETSTQTSLDLADWPDGPPVGEPRTPGCNKGVYPGFPTLFWGLSVLFVGDLDGKGPVEARGKRCAFFHGALGAFCASTAPSASTGPVRVGQDGSQGGGPCSHVELDRRVLGLQSTGE